MPPVLYLIDASIQKAQSIKWRYRLFSLVVETKKIWNVIVLGAGAAGLLCALTEGGRGKRMLTLEKSNKVGQKILMSGCDRCNVTRLYTEPEI
jgi:ribulose 1,5-bisphosphate synthetase/thiazole synthase